MGIGRREFLKLFGGAIATQSSAIHILDDLYVNWKLGIAFRKPHGWTFGDVQEMGKVVAGQILDFDDVDLATELADSAELPILTISKDRLSADADRFTPGITIYLDFIEDFPGDVEIEPAFENVSGDIHSCELMLKDFRVTSSPQPTQISECDAVEYGAAFVFEHENMEPTPVRMRTLTIYQIPAIYTLRMYDSPISEPNLIFDYTPFVNSVKLV